MELYQGAREGRADGHGSCVLHWARGCGGRVCGGVQWHMAIWLGLRSGSAVSLRARHQGIQGHGKVQGAGPLRLAAAAKCWLKTRVCSVGRAPPGMPGLLGPSVRMIRPRVPPLSLFFLRMLDTHHRLSISPCRSHLSSGLNLKRAKMYFPLTADETRWLCAAWNGMAVITCVTSFFFFAEGRSSSSS
jgi:hypothetical protein